MSDGHSRNTGQDFDESQTRHFKFKLTFNKEASGRGVFVIHASSSSLSFSGGLTPFDFLQQLGFRHYKGECPHYHERCFYLETWELPRDSYGHSREAEYAHSQIKDLTRDVEEMYDSLRNVYQKLSRHMELCPLTPLHAQQPPPVLDLSGNEPGWLYEHKTKLHKDAEESLKKAEETVEKLNVITHSLWGTGDALEDSVLAILKDLGLEANKTERGFTVDILASFKEVGSFAFEVTGLNDAIKKKSGKIGQAFSFLQEHHSDEKTVILANTFNDLPLVDRGGKIHFTDDAIKLIAPQGIVGMTCVDLYNIWKDVKSGEKSVAEVFSALHAHPGGAFQYPSE